MISTPSFSLRLPERRDARLLLEGRNSLQVHPFLFEDPVLPTAENMQRLEKRLMAHERPMFIFSQDNKPLGLVNLTHWDRKHGLGEWTFYLWAPDAPKGSGTLMLSAFLDEIFLRRGLRKLCSRVLYFNGKALHLHRKLGFSEEGVLKEHIIKNHTAHDVVALGLLDRDWRIRRESFLPLLEQVHMETSDMQDMAL